MEQKGSAFTALSTDIFSVHQHFFLNQQIWPFNPPEE